jgi:hypothetical protein
MAMWPMLYAMIDHSTADRRAALRFRDGSHLLDAVFNTKSVDVDLEVEDEMIGFARFPVAERQNRVPEALHIYPT